MITPIELHTPEQVAAEVERMRASPEMMWWMRLLNGYWAMQGESGESLMRTEAYNRLTMMIQ